VITVIQQDGELGNIDRLCFEIVAVELQHFKQSLLSADVRPSAIAKEGKPKRLDSKMPLNPIRRCVEPKSFRVHTRIASIFERLRVNDD